MPIFYLPYPGLLNSNPMLSRNRPISKSGDLISKFQFLKIKENRIISCVVGVLTKHNPSYRLNCVYNKVIVVTANA